MWIARILRPGSRSPSSLHVGTFSIAALDALQTSGMVSLRLENLATDANLESVVLYAAIFATYSLHTRKACMYHHVYLAIPDSFGSSMSCFPHVRLRHIYNSISDSVSSSSALRTSDPCPFEVFFLFMANTLEILRCFAWFLFGSDDILFCLF
jgi:hypothetical protein